MLQERVSERLFSIYSYRTLHVTVWRGAPTAAAVEIVDRELNASSGKFVFASLILTGTRLPDAAARAALERSIKASEGRTMAAAVLIEESGFVGAAVRALMTGINLLLRPPYPMSFMATASEVAAFVAKHWPPSDGPAPSATDLSASFARIIAAR